MAAGARTKCKERRPGETHEDFIKRKKVKALIAAAEARMIASERHNNALIAAAEVRIAATEKRIRWMQEFRARYSQFLLETRILTRPYVRRSYRLFTRRLAIFKREYELSTQKQWPFTDRTDFPFVMFCPVESL